MLINRRHIGALAAGLASASAMTSVLSTSALADDAADVNKAVDALRAAMLAADAAALKDILADQLTYVHSSGKLDTKDEFLAIVGGKKTIYKSITLEDPKTTLVGSTAIIRHIFTGEAETDGKVNPFKVGAMQIWMKQDGKWRLLARQAFRLA